MQLMTFNSLLMFDIVFMFFLFLVGVTCLVYYLPTGKPQHRSSPSLAHTTSNLPLTSPLICRRHRHPRLFFCNNQHQYHQAAVDDELRSDGDCDSEISLMDYQKDELELMKCHTGNDEIDMEEGLTNHNEIEQHVKLCRQSHYPPLAYDKQTASNGADAVHYRQHKILYHCCPPCDLSDCEHYYVSADEISSQAQQRQQMTADSSLTHHTIKKKQQRRHNNNIINSNLIRSSTNNVSNQRGCDGGGRFLNERYRRVQSSTTSSQLSLRSESSASSISLGDVECLQECCSPAGAAPVAGAVALDVINDDTHIQDDDDDSNSDIIIYNGTNNRFNSKANFTDHFVVVKETERDFHNYSVRQPAHHHNYDRCSSPEMMMMMPLINTGAPHNFTIPTTTTASMLLPKQPYCCHVKAKLGDIKDCMGPIADV